ncbi:MAG: BrnT family toxin [Nostoc sp. CreGUA01]|nr:BrnT family toxin [Nostoc sp. CreGUA01]
MALIGTKRNSAKCWNRVSQEEIEYLFQQPGILIAPDIQHSENEDRYLAIGISSRERYIFVAFTFRNKQDRILIRPISVRYMRDKGLPKNKLFQIICTFVGAHSCAPLRWDVFFIGSP